MNIRNKILLLFFSSVLILVSVMLLFRRAQLQQSDLIIKSAAGQQVVLINTILKVHSEQLDQLITDYCNWDDITYIQKPNHDWAKDNIGSIIKSF